MNLSGHWHNQLGSKMALTADGKGGLSGEYNSAVGKAEFCYALTGRYDTHAPKDGGVSVGWTVSFQNSHKNANSTTTWSGQYFLHGGDERIITHWLLTSSTTPDNVWQSTHIGTDTFTRDKPSIAEIAKYKAMTVGSPSPEEILASRVLVAKT